MIVGARVDSDVVRPGATVTAHVRVRGGAGPLRLVARLLLEICLEPEPGTERECVTLEMGTPEIALVAAPMSAEEDIALALQVPPDAPASAAGLADWRLTLRIEHRDGEPIELAAPLTVVGTAALNGQLLPRSAGWLPDTPGCRLDLDLEQLHVAPGSRVSGVLRTSLGHNARGGSWDVAVRLVGVWHRRDPAREQVLLESATCRPWPEPAERPRPGRTYLFPFVLDLAAGAPPSFDAGITALAWYVLAECTWGDHGAQEPERCAAAQTIHVGLDAAGVSSRATPARAGRLDPTPPAAGGSTPTG